MHCLVVQQIKNLKGDFMPKKIKQKEDDKLKSAQKVIKDAQERKMKKCNAEIQAVLKKYSFNLDVRANVILIDAPQRQPIRKPDPKGEQE
jgi:hypothetical protein